MLQNLSSAAAVIGALRVKIKNSLLRSKRCSIYPWKIKFSNFTSLESIYLVIIILKNKHDKINTNLSAMLLLLGQSPVVQTS